MSEMDFSGFDNASLDALYTHFDEIALDSAIDGTNLPDPVDDAAGAGAADLTDEDVLGLVDADLDGLDVVGLDAGGDGLGQGATDAPIVASDGTAYGSYADFLRGPGPGRG